MVKMHRDASKSGQNPRARMHCNKGVRFVFKRQLHCGSGIEHLILLALGLEESGDIALVIYVES